MIWKILALCACFGAFLIVALFKKAERGLPSAAEREEDPFGARGRNHGIGPYFDIYAKKWGEDDENDNG